MLKEKNNFLEKLLNNGSSNNTLNIGSSINVKKISLNKNVKSQNDIKKSSSFDIEQNNSSNNNNNNKNYRADKIFEEFPPENGSSQGSLNEYDCNKLHERLIYGGKIIDFCSSDNESVSDLKALLLKLSKSKKELLFLIF
jgi:hypothetical protein